MLKLSALALGLLTAISIAPATLANPISGYDNAAVYQHNDRTNRPQVSTAIYQRTDRANRPQVVVVNANPQTRWEVRRRQLVLAREQEARSRWNARHSHYRHYDNNHANNYYPNNNYGNNHSEYRHNR
jgi:hypothetical protein